MRIHHLAFALLCSPALAAPSQALAQSKLVLEAADLVECASIEEPERRLECYDSLVESLSLKADDGAANALYAFSGEGDADSEIFSTTEPWVLQWRVEGSIVSFELQDDNGQPVRTIGQQIGDGAGRSDPQGPGGYILAVRGIGKWTVTVLPAD